MVVYEIKTNIPPDSEGRGALRAASVRYGVVNDFGERDFVVLSVIGVNAVIPRGAGRGARPELNEGLRERARQLALHHFFLNVERDF